MRRWLIVRILVVGSSPFSYDGFSNQIYNLCKSLALAGHDMHLMAFHRAMEGAVDVWEVNGVVVQVPQGEKLDQGKKLFRMYRALDNVNEGTKQVFTLLMHYIKPDTVISLQDFHRVSFMPEFTIGVCPWYHWATVDFTQWDEVLSQWAYETQVRLVMMSKFGYELAKKSMYVPEMYIPHGYDPSIFYPLPDKAKVRAEIGFFPGMGKFAFGYIGTNSERKRPDLLLEAYAKFAANKSDVVLHMHTDINEPYPEARGYDLQRLVMKNRLQGKAYSSNRLQYLQKHPPKFMSKLINAFDVMVSATSGEGFGVPTLEAEACGVPSIITDATTSQELVQDHGWLVPVLTESLQQGYMRAEVNTDKMAEAMEDAYQHRDKVKEFGLKAAEHAKEYTFDKVGKMWVDLLSKR